MLPTVAADSTAKDKSDDEEKVHVDVREVEATSLPKPRGWRKPVLVTLLTGAMFFDIVAGCSAIAALPTVRMCSHRALNMLRHSYATP